MHNSILLSIIDTVTNTVHATIYCRLVAPYWGHSNFFKILIVAMGYCLSPFYFNLYSIVDTVTNTIHATVDTTKNVAAAAVDKSSSLIGSAKGTV